MLEISSNTSTSGTYGVGVGPLVQKQPVGKLTVGRHSKPIIYKIWIKESNSFESWKIYKHIARDINLISKKVLI